MRSYRSKLVFFGILWPFLCKFATPKWMSDLLCNSLIASPLMSILPLRSFFASFLLTLYNFCFNDPLNFWMFSTIFGSELDEYLRSFLAGKAFYSDVKGTLLPKIMGIYATMTCSVKLIYLHCYWLFGYPLIGNTSPVSAGVLLNVLVPRIVIWNYSSTFFIGDS